MTGNYDKVWAFDIDRDSANVHHGAIYWGQFMHDANHTGKYVNPLVGIKNPETNVPSGFVLYQNYPNPFNPTTKIKFDLPLTKGAGGMNDRLTIYDILGREVSTLVNEELKPGSYEYEWSATGGGSKYSSGVYFYHLQAGDYRETKKMLLVR